MNPDGVLFWTHNYRKILAEHGYRTLDFELGNVPGRANKEARQILLARRER